MGKKIGKTKADFFREEKKALNPFIPGLFDGLLESWSYAAQPAWTPALKSVSLFSCLPAASKFPASSHWTNA